MSGALTKALEPSSSSRRTGRRSRHSSPTARSCCAGVAATANGQRARPRDGRRRDAERLLRDGRAPGRGRTSSEARWRAGRRAAFGGVAGAGLGRGAARPPAQPVVVGAGLAAGPRELRASAGRRSERGSATGISTSRSPIPPRRRSSALREGARAPRRPDGEGLRAGGGPPVVAGRARSRSRSRGSSSTSSRARSRTPEDRAAVPQGVLEKK